MNRNYGGQLQAFALQKVISNMGYECEQIAYYLRRPGFFEFDPAWAEENKHLTEQYHALMRFSEAIPHSDKKYTPDDIHACANKYDAFVCGSDVIWCSNYGQPAEELATFLLGFVPDDRVKVAYAASIGGKGFLPKYDPVFESCLSRFDAISMREKSAIPAISDCTDKHVTAVLDPTMLLPASYWKEIAVFPKKQEKYLLCYFADPETLQMAGRLAETMGLQVIPINGPEKGIGAEELIGFFNGADFVLTNSFHGIAFSLLFHKQFIAVERVTDNSPTSINVRLTDILETFGLQRRLVKAGDDIGVVADLPPIDYESVDKILLERREFSLKFLSEALSIEKEEPPAGSKQLCNGCSACKAICPSNCIKMRPEMPLGFQYPEINAGICSKCRKCREVCPVRHATKDDPAKKPDAFAAYAIDRELRLASSSGGVFSVLAERIIEGSGIVFGAILEDNLVVRHGFATTLEGIERFRGSKYVQSEIGDSYKQAKQFLDDGKTVLFTGTPCQIEGLKRSLGREYDNLITVDFICHGVCSPELWAKYIAEKKKEVKSASFRDKTFGWFDPSTGGYRFSMRIDYADSSQEVIPLSDDSYLYLYLQDVFLRDSCYRCTAKKINRVSDLTVADFWGVEDVCPEMFDRNGVSMVLVHSEKGRRMFQSAANSTKSKKVDFEKAIRKNKSINTSANIPPNRSYLVSIMNDRTVRELRQEHECYKLRVKSEKIPILQGFARDVMLEKLARTEALGLTLTDLIGADRNVFIYGAGLVGKAACKLLGSAMVAFIDKANMSFENEQNEGFPVYHPNSEELRSIIEQGDDSATILVTPVWDIDEIRSEMRSYEKARIASIWQALRDV